MDWQRWAQASLTERIEMCDDSTLLVELLYEEGGMSMADALDLGNYPLEDAKRMALAETKEKERG